MKILSFWHSRQREYKDFTLIKTYEMFHERGARDGVKSHNQKRLRSGMYSGMCENPSSSKKLYIGLKTHQDLAARQTNF